MADVAAMCSVRHDEMLMIRETSGHFLSVANRSTTIHLTADKKHGQGGAQGRPELLADNLLGCSRRIAAVGDQVLRLTVCQTCSPNARC
jgi:hypothetical protein